MGEQLCGVGLGALADLLEATPRMGMHRLVAKRRWDSVREGSRSTWGRRLAGWGGEKVRLWCGLCSRRAVLVVVNGSGRVLR